MGGAMVLGAMPRIVRHRCVRDAIVMAVGIAMLANTRPYEGLVLTVAASGCLIFWIASRMAKQKVSAGVWLRQTVLPMLLVLGLAGAATGYYFWKVTGSPLRMPQQVNRETYAVARYFYWQTAYPVREYHHKEIRDFYYGRELEEFEKAHKTTGILAQTATKVAMIWVFYFSPLLTVPLCWLFWVIRDRRIRPLLIVG